MYYLEITCYKPEVYSYVPTDEWFTYEILLTKEIYLSIKDRINHQTGRVDTNYRSLDSLLNDWIKEKQSSSYYERLVIVSCFLRKTIDIPDNLYNNP
ncbi:MAG TPA: hypothetical protein PLS49_04480 [Candidatus Woesebacteria bacterium]|nr:hypothetical protein [Candidatus Woesebacteria bacterium]